VVTLIEEVVAPLLQLYVPLPVAVKVADEEVQVSTAEEGETEAEGEVLFKLTEALALAVHPLPPVTVTK